MGPCKKERERRQEEEEKEEEGGGGNEEEARESEMKCKREERSTGPYIIRALDKRSERKKRSHDDRAAQCTLRTSHIAIIKRSQHGI